jgi:hypothetical protein
MPRATGAASGFSHRTPSAARGSRAVTGVVLPAKELCALARSKGILSAVDGAHVVGMMKGESARARLRPLLLGPHKWRQTPKGSGFLYVRDELIDRPWNTLATEGWDEPKLPAERFQRIASSNVPALAGMRAALRLAEQIGMERIEKRHRAMADYILGEMLKRGAESWTSPIQGCAAASRRSTCPASCGWTSRTGCGRRSASASGAASHPSPHRHVERFLEGFDAYRALQGVRSSHASA